MQRLIRFELENKGIFQFSDWEYNTNEGEDLKIKELKSKLKIPEISWDIECEFYFTKEGFKFCKELIKLMTKNNKGRITIKRDWLKKEGFEYQDKHQAAKLIRERRWML